MLLPELEYYIENPSQIKNLQAEKLWQLLKEYPYFQSARLMLARQLHDTGHEAFPLSLKLAAAYAADRTLLRELIEGLIPDAEEKPASQLQPQIIENEPVTDIIHASHDITIEASPVFSDKQLEAIRLIKSRLNNIIFVEDQDDAQSLETGNVDYQGFNDIIERFLKDNPKISTPRRDFFKPADVARQSSVEPEDVVTETLAWVYEKQGLNEKAIKIYEKLVLLFPEKSTYFAARIKNLEESRK